MNEYDITKAPAIAPHFSSNDWCHVCGKRSDNTADIWWPRNAEHDKRVYAKSDAAAARYLRICLSCCLLAAEASRDVPQY